jgi:hypothetical protein
MSIAEVAGCNDRTLVCSIMVIEFRALSKHGKAATESCECDAFPNAITDAVVIGVLTLHAIPTRGRFMHCGLSTLAWS